MKNEWIWIAAATGLVVFAIIMRLVPHAANVAPIGALAFWSGRYVTGKWAYFFPIVALLISDALIGFYSWPILFVVYGGWMIMTALGQAGHARKNPAVLAGSVLTGSVIFFVTTNAAVWGFSSLYTKTFAGFINCFVQALPFFRNSLLGDLYYATIFVSVTEFVRAGYFRRSMIELRNLVRPEASAHVLKTESLR